MSQYFPKCYEPFGGDINVKADLSNYATKTDLKNVSHVDLAKLSSVVKNDVGKKTEYNKLVTKVDNIDSTDFVKKAKYEKDGSDFEDKINKIDKKYRILVVWLKKNNGF